MCSRRAASTNTSVIGPVGVPSGLKDRPFASNPTRNGFGDSRGSPALQCIHQGRKDDDKSAAAIHREMRRWLDLFKSFIHSRNAVGLRFEPRRFRNQGIRQSFGRVDQPDFVPRTMVIQGALRARTVWQPRVQISVPSRRPSAVPRTFSSNALLTVFVSRI